ncbi:MAG: amidohydrolase family protein [Deltaproteobacteria bacterium]|nr:amidohydrolase family protein [Deltaproteobacteria bacterium]
MIDYLIKNGTIIDGGGTQPIEADIGIFRDRICFIGKDEVSAKNVLDAKGLIISPGFIDVHSHSEFTLLADNRAEGKISQGVTTEINGNCGLSAAPLYNEALEQREIDLDELNIKERWSTLGGYLGTLEKKGIALNFATLCGHGNIRASVMGYKDKKPDNDEIIEMKKLLKEAIQDGAKGISTGLIYPPGVYAGTEELIELCSELRTMPPNVSIGGPNSELIDTSHMRSEGDKLIESLEEVIRIAKETGIKVHISQIKTSVMPYCRHGCMKVEGMRK